MEPQREYITKNGIKIEEFLWNGKLKVYINNQKSNKTFEQELDLQLKSEAK